MARDSSHTFCCLCSAMTKWSCMNYCDVRFCSYWVMSLMGQSLFGLPIRTAAIRHATRIDIDLSFIGIHGENHATCRSTSLPQPWNVLETQKLIDVWTSLRCIELGLKCKSRLMKKTDRRQILSLISVTEKGKCRHPQLYHREVNCFCDCRSLLLIQLAKKQ